MPTPAASQGSSTASEDRRAHLIGAKPGAVKNLPGFRKGFHKIPATLPDMMLERQIGAICAPELEPLATGLFEKLRAARGYKRKEISLAVDAPNATLTTVDFILDISYTLGPDDPSDYLLTYDLHTIRDIGIFADGSLNDVFAGVFNRVAFSFGASIRMEDLIDELEDAPGGASNLRYPPDCSECSVRLPGFAGEVRVTPRSLEVISPAAASPAELVKTFVEASSVLAANPTLEKLIPRRKP
jgi:hypothetical protein